MKELEEMYLKYGSPVKRYVFSLCNNNALADDITADTFYKAMKNIDSFKSGRIFTWLCAIARNTYLDYVGKKEYANISLSETEELEVQTVDEKYSPERAYIRKDERITLYRMIQKLDVESRDIIYLRIFADLSFKEIGGILGRSENWARVTFYRSKNKLKGWMENEN